jgi:hypothetical protein
MFDNTKLPWRPAIFIPLYLGLFILFLMMRWFSIAAYFAAGILHIWWIVAAVRFALRNQNRDASEAWATQRGAKLKRMCKIAIAGFVTTAVINLGLEKFGLAENIIINVIVVPLNICVIIYVFALLWLAGRTIIEADGRYDKNETGTSMFLALFYLPLAILFPYRRLKRLLDA